ncbi:hypothetical protein [Micromonospora sp. NPDC050276]|uniref:hypothetical protein n=1 Tax=Micromonospora sp. NPDC050276 TaxID=3364278 RepID=UPI0037887C16
MTRAWVSPSGDRPGYTYFWSDPDPLQHQETLRRKVEATNFRTQRERELDPGSHLEAAVREYEMGSTAVLRQLAGGAEGQANG